MKKPFTRKLCIALLSALLPMTGTWAQTFSGGSGTEQDPYKIASEADLNTLAGLCTPSTAAKANTEGKFFKLTQDLDLTGATFKQLDYFYGTLDGNGHTISNFTTNKGGFTNENHGTICNLNFDATCDISKPWIIEGGEIGTIANSHLGSMRNCRSAATVHGLYYETGGLVGIIPYVDESTPTIEHCEFSGLITGDMCNMIGGIVGYGAEAYVVYDCLFSGTIHNTSTGVSSGIGGITSSFCYLERCIVTGTIIIDYDAYNIGAIYGVGEHPYGENNFYDPTKVSITVNGVSLDVNNCALGVWLKAQGFNNDDFRAMPVFDNPTNTWATFYGDNEFRIPEGMKAYIVTGFDEASNSVIVKEKDYIYSAVPMLLEYTDHTGVYVLEPFSLQTELDLAEEAYENLYNGINAECYENYVGVYQGKLIEINNYEDYYYVLFNDEFVRANTGVVPGGHCYLIRPRPQTGVIPKISIHKAGETTAVTTISQPSGCQTVFNLQGQQVVQPRKGLYIKDGRKIIIK